MPASDALLFLGVDGGATKCRGRLRESSGALLAQAEGPAANVYVDFDRAVSVARDIVFDTIHLAGLTGKDTNRISLGLGLAGMSDAADSAHSPPRFPISPPYGSSMTRRRRVWARMRARTADC